MNPSGIIPALMLAMTAFIAPAMSQEGDEPDKLLIGLLPAESAPTVLRLNMPLQAYLERTLGIPVEFQVGANYAATGEALRFGRIDIAYLGPVTYVLQSERARLRPFARPSHPSVGPTFKAAVVVDAESAVDGLDDLRGTDVLFGDPASTSGTWVPQFELLSAGLRSGRDYRAYFLGGHDAVVHAVINGKAAAGGVSRAVLDRLISEGKIEDSDIRILLESRPIPEYAWTFREGLDEDFMEKVSRAFLEIDDPDVLDVFHAEAFVPAKDGDFSIVREWVQALESAQEQR